MLEEWLDGSKRILQSFHANDSGASSVDRRVGAVSASFISKSIRVPRVLSLSPENSDFTIKSIRTFFLECFWISGHILQTVQAYCTGIMKNSTVIITVQYHCTVCAIIRTICRYMYSDYGLPIILH